MQYILVYFIVNDGKETFLRFVFSAFEIMTLEHYIYHQFLDFG